MKIRATIEYHVNPNDYNNVTEIEEQEQCRLIACLKHFWQTYTSAHQSVKVEEVE